MGEGGVGKTVSFDRREFFKEKLVINLYFLYCRRLPSNL